MKTNPPHEIEKGGCEKKQSFAEFVEAYQLDDNRHLLKGVAENITTHGFYAHTRVPDGQGFFGANVKGASWCDPSEWHRKYFENRKTAQPSCFGDD